VAHAENRAFYDLTGGKNLFSYMTTESKLKGNFTALEYLQKSTGVFNQNGMIDQTEVEAMKQRAAQNEGFIWHGFISLNEEESHKIDTPEKCIALVKRTFGKFFKDAHLKESNLDLMCALHLDRPHHLHIHFLFWEKEPIYNYNGTKSFRRKGKIDQSAIDNMFVSLGLAIDDRKDKLYTSRDAALNELREMTSIKTVTSIEEIKKAVIGLAKDLPKTGRLSYGSKDMESYRGRVDVIVEMLLDYDGAARRADKNFYKALAERERTVKNICGGDFAFSDKNISEAKMQDDLPKYNYKIDESKIKLIAEIEADYKRRQGNLVLNLAKFIKPELFERKQGKRYKTNDNALKRVISISEKKVDRLFKKFSQSFGRDFEYISREHRNRLREIEDEMKRDKNAEKQEIKKEEELNIGQEYGVKT
jgi:hypothetical protein